MGKRATLRIVVAGGGAAGFFGALACATANPGAEITILEKSPRFLAKVLISGGGRCNVTNASFDPGDLASKYPRGGKELIGAFHRFQPRDTISWFEHRGIALKAEEDGRIFPTTDSSSTIADCLLEAAAASGVRLRSGTAVRKAAVLASGGFGLDLADRQTLYCDRLLLATGGCRTVAAGNLAASLGHTLEPPVPSLFSFHITDPLIADLAGISLPQVSASVPETNLCQEGSVLVTHWGLSGPVILRLSAWGARELRARNYQFPVRIHWAAPCSEEEVERELDSTQGRHRKRLVINTPIFQIPARLWTRLVSTTGIGENARWASLSRVARRNLVQRICRTEMTVSGKSLNKEEFVTCGGVRLCEVDFRTMQSRISPGLFFAGELLDIDGLTGGFNFQAAWTTGWIAGNAMAR